MLHHGSYGISARTKIFSWVEFGRIFRQELAHFGGHGKTKVCVDVDLAYTIFGCFPYHFFRNALSSGDVAAVQIALIHEFFENGGSAVKYKRSIGYQLMYSPEPFKIKIRFAFALLCAVAGADGYGQRVYSSPFHELRSLIRVCKSG